MWKCKECGFAYNVDNSETCKQCNAPKPAKDQSMINHEEILRKVALICLVGGCIIAVSIFLLTGIVLEKRYSGYEFDGISWAGIVYFLIAVLISVTFWSALNVLANISCSLKKMSEKK